jgi:hypothetical protein
MTVQFRSVRRALPRLALAAASLAAVSLGGAARADTLLQDTFALGPRPGAGQQPDNIAIGTGLNGKRAQVPGTAGETWITSSPGASWAFSASSTDPFEAPAAGGNGTVTYQVRDENPPRPSFAVALLGLTAPAQMFQESLDVVTGIGDLAIGFTSSTNVSGDTFGQFGLFSLDLKTSLGTPGIGAWTLTTADGGQLTGTTVLGGFNRLALSYDPVGHLVQGSVNGVATGTLGYEAIGIAAVGFQGTGTVDNFRLDAAALAGAVPEPTVWAMMLLGFGGLGAALRRRRAAAPA